MQAHLIFTSHSAVQAGISCTFACGWSPSSGVGFFEAHHVEVLSLGFFQSSVLELLLDVDQAAIQLSHRTHKSNTVLEERDVHKLGTETIMVTIRCWKSKAHASITINDCVAEAVVLGRNRADAVKHILQLPSVSRLLVLLSNPSVV